MLRCMSIKARPGHLIQLKKLTPAIIDGRAIPTSQNVLLDTDAQCGLSEIDRSKPNFSNEGGVKQRVMGSNKTKI